MQTFRMLNRPLGILAYQLLPNDLAWSALSAEERELILANNRAVNVERTDYANPEQYGAVRMKGGENWDSVVPRDTSLRGQHLLETLRRLKPTSVIEVGPGAGYFTREICALPETLRYTAIDINRAFLDYLRPRLADVAASRPGFQFELLHGAIESIHEPLQADLVILLSCVHHIPDRTELFSKLSGWLTPEGRIFCYDPSHYLVRLAQLAYKYFKKRAYQREYYEVLTRWSTHAFCSAGEYRRIARALPALSIEREFFSQPRKLRKIPGLTKMLPRLLSTEMGVLLKRTNN